MDEMETICFQIISNAGTARSLIVEALQEARDGNFDQVQNKFDEANKYFTEAHKVHASLIQQEAKGDGVPFSLLFMHAEDQLMSTETIKHMAKEMIHLYERV
ncbi:PTS lactose/cellobiose transporter subunit IIA [Virgibacillus sp. 179-BFC.A HS]|uniref:PTS lactose/cellobiose transporter subunit IIA n=1 Tax=Tigheibacillus jepli TaxID=3035914 RepID=A0ABU5CJJ9_9BACI|nr:PTS lactose/cellobiose transporter subunit IIA [Virgibacillus sp. 179-BFC.A HS]MDY0406494.1 PTS lactose/cellobiose transporter subunit IIA [Virgibacillus sp. 179-BFC.A HS]